MQNKIRKTKNKSSNKLAYVDSSYLSTYGRKMMLHQRKSKSLKNGTISVFDSYTSKIDKSGSKTKSMQLIDLGRLAIMALHIENQENQ